MQLGEAEPSWTPEAPGQPTSGEWNMAHLRRSQVLNPEHIGLRLYYGCHYLR